MLSELRIKNFALIDDDDIIFLPGVSALIGETGAGKSLIVSAISLLEGKRADFDKLRDDKQKAFVEGLFSFSKPFIAAHKELEGYIAPDGTMSVNRTLLPSKAAYARINGETCSLQTLREVMAKVIDIHSQGDSSLLYDPKNYLPLLDAYGAKKEKDYKEAYEAFNKAYKGLKEAQAALSAFIKDNDLSKKEFLAYQIEEIEKAHLKENEIEELNEELDKMDSFEKAQQAYKDLKDYLSSGEEGELGSEFQSEVLRRLKAFAGTSLEKEALQAASGLDALFSSLGQIDESFLSLGFSQERLEEINSRLFALSDLQHKYGRSSQEILAKLAGFKKEKENLDAYDERLQECQKKALESEKDAFTAGEKLTEARKKASADLEKAVNDEVFSLGMKEGGFKIALAREEKVLPTGLDSVSFLIQMNKGGKTLPLKEAASGGENSRLSLALKAAFNALSPYDTIVFDEIDSGISGSIAAKAGEKIYQIGQDSFVLTITHLPQVAARADNVYYVYKDSAGEQTSSHLVRLDAKREEEEIAKMLSGSKVSDASKAAAKELIASSRAKK